MSGSRSTQSAIWIVALLVAMLMPWLFYNYHTGRHSGFVVSMLSQMGMMSILALSYNMLLGQAGLFSFCHATFFGIGASELEFVPEALIMVGTCPDRPTT